MKMKKSDLKNTDRIFYSIFNFFLIIGGVMFILSKVPRRLFPLGRR